MALLGKIVVAVSLLLPRAAAAADCSKESCLVDETSFVQMKQAIKHGSERSEQDASWPGPPVDEDFPDAATGHLDAGLADAFEANFAKAKKSALTAAGHAFHRDRALEKLASPAEFVSIGTQDDNDVQRHLLRDREAVHAAFARRIAVQRAALAKMTKAKEAFEAHAIKEAQAEAAAALGQAEGQREGQDEAASRLLDWQQATAAAAAKKAATDQKNAAAKASKAERDSIDKATKAKAAADRAYAKKAAGEAQAAEAANRAAAVADMNWIEGVDGLKDRELLRLADLYSKKMDKQTDSEQSTIDKDAGWSDDY